METGGGAAVNGETSTGGGDFVARDKVTKSNARQINDIRIEAARNRDNDDYRWLQLESRVSNLQAEMNNRFLILDSQREVTRDRNEQALDDLSEQIRRLERPIPVAGSERMQIFLMLLMIVLTVIILYFISELHAISAKMSERQTTVQQQTEQKR